MQTKGAKMQDLNWNDLRHILAVSRGGSLRAAARLLRVDDTTVARRLAALSRSLGARLYQRLPGGTLRLTPSGERAALEAERMESKVATLRHQSPDAVIGVSGTVRLTSVPIIVNRMLVPAAVRLFERYPRLGLELVADARDLSLTRREADLALRLARPRTGGTRVTARRLGTLRYGVYAAAAYAAREARRLPWITFDEGMAHLPQARWIAAAAGRADGVAPLRLNDAEGVLEAVLAGLGRSLLPCTIADRDSRLRRIGGKRAAPTLTRELWLLVHRELRDLERIRAVIDWLDWCVARRLA
jgi:DNA-binding transcriptional LysR family regulator